MSEEQKQPKPMPEIPAGQDPGTYWWGVVELNQELQQRIKELEAEVETQVDHKLVIMQQKNAEIERLRKAIERHKDANTGMAGTHSQSNITLWSALTPSPATPEASASNVALGVLRRAEAERDAAADNEALRGIDVAASGENGEIIGTATIRRGKQLEPRVIDDEPVSAPAAESRKIGVCYRCGGKLLNGHKCPPQYRTNPSTDQ